MLLGRNELKYSLLIAYVCLFMNFAPNEHTLAHCQLKQFQLFLSFQQHIAFVIHLLRFFFAKKSVPNVQCWQTDANRTTYSEPGKC
jgi:hypothetical protein